MPNTNSANLTIADVTQMINKSAGPIAGETRVRFAPSPTGFLHVGGARTHLFNWLHARHSKGKLILRIEDTDQARSTRESELMVIQDIKSLGLDPDEGPLEGGPCAPYRQSERQELFKALAYQLMEKGQAFRCFCTDEIMEQKAIAAKAAGKNPHYDGTCALLTPAESESRTKSGEQFSIRMKAPQQDYICNDILRGEVHFKAGMVGDFVVLRSNGMPVYNFSVVVDDHFMNITHVIRGEDHLSNTVRQIMIYEAFGWELPKFAHISMILGTDKKKLSKREGASSVNDYLQNGYLPEALINFLALLGWSAPDGKEIHSVSEIIEMFNIEHLHKSPAVFDDEKLNWMNGEYIRAMDIHELVKRVRPFAERAGYNPDLHGEEWFLKVIESLKNKFRLLSEIGSHLEVYYGDRFAFENEVREVLATAEAKNVVRTFREEAEKHSVLNEAAITEIQNIIKTKTGAKGKSLFLPMRACVTGKQHGPELAVFLPLIGTKEALRRMDLALGV